ncbi:MAG TPA: FAD-dependent oxidoreductase [Caulobacteraceae bacterium]|nr:FAD-dependent oxidoreductase [Caulobacteraceae bacterium]
MGETTSRVVIVGAGHAGGSAAAFLRQFGFEGEITVVGEEPLAPYQRPPLSKAWLKGEADGESLLLRPQSFYAEQSIDLRLATRVTHIDRTAKHVALTGGELVAYDLLILATGSNARKLPIPGANDPTILELRTAAEADALKAALTPGQKLIVVGAGYIGLEVAASARALGCEAVVVEREARVLARVASAPLSAFFERYHRDRGVEILVNALATSIDPTGHAVALSDGRVIEGDAVLVGVGAVACDLLGSASGLHCDGGIVVDEDARTSDPSVYAIGDCTNRPLPIYGARLRLESVPNALEQAKQAAASICGRPRPAPETPWFWSDQYDLKLQIAGVSLGPDRLVIRGNLEENHFAIFHLKGARMLAVEAVNAPAEFMAGKLLILKQHDVNPEQLANVDVAMKTLLA